jgi:hypothetical protein
MTLEEAKKHVMRLVVYRPKVGPTEVGVITSVNEHVVFVRYGADTHSKATKAEDLELTG